MRLEYISLVWWILFLPLLAAAAITLFTLQAPQRERAHFHRRDCRRLRPDALCSSTPNGFYVNAEASVNWLTIGNLHIDFGLKLDALSLMMMLIVTGVGGAIHIYSYGYMDDDRGKARFFACPEPVHLLDARHRAGEQFH